MKFKFGLLLFLIVVVSAYITMKTVIKGKEVEVPSVTGLSIIQAKTLLQTKGLYLREGDFMYDDTIPADKIFSQDPASGELVKKGRNIWVSVSKGSKMVTVPDLTGMEFNKAQNVILASGLILGDKAVVKSIPEGKDIVIAQNPMSQTLVKRGEKINLLVNSRDLAKIYLMPDFMGKDADVSKRALREAGVIVKASYEKSDEPKDAVIGQIPQAGTMLKDDDTVEFIVASDIGSESSRYVPVVFEVPREETGMKRVKIKITDDKGERIILNEMYNAGEKVEVGIKVKGETKIEIYVNDILIEEKNL